MKPVFGITAGDPSGIGYEIVLKALHNHRKSFHKIIPVVFADANILRYYSDLFKLYVKINTINSFTEIKDSDTVINCYQVNTKKFSPDIGRIDSQSGLLAFKSIEKSIEIANSGQLKGVITAPINKESLKAAAVPYLDHTEIFTKLTNSAQSMTLFVTGNLRIFFHTRHIALKDVSQNLDSAEISASLAECHKHLNKIKIINPRIALAALNPHGGESGMFGNEETEILEPAVRMAKSNGINVEGPVPADSVFHLAATGKFDAVLSLYHDQGHIAAKTLDFYKTVAITMGLPFIRTSVDHGTGFDIAGKGIASEISLVEAIKTAEKYYW